MVPDLISAIAGSVGAGTGLAALGVSYAQLQVARGRDFCNRVVRYAGTSEEDLADRLRADEARQIVFGEALEVAAVAGWETKRETLARIVVDSLSDSEWRVDELSLLVRTAGGLGPNEVTVLSELAKPRPDLHPDGHFMGGRTVAELANTLPTDTAPLLPPVLGALSTSGVIIDGALGAWDYGGPCWLVTRYGFRFLRYLLPAEHVGTAVVAVALGTAKLFVRNLGYGPSTVTSLEASTDGRDLLVTTRSPIRVDAGELVEVACNTDIEPNGSARLGVAWSSDDGQHHQADRFQRRH